MKSKQYSRLLQNCRICFDNGEKRVVTTFYTVGGRRGVVSLIVPRYVKVGSRHNAGGSRFCVIVFVISCINDIPRMGSCSNRKLFTFAVIE